MALDRNSRWLVWLGSLSILLAAVILVSSWLGYARINPSRVLRIVFSRIPFVNIEKDWSDSDELVIMGSRLPRILMACVVGAGLALAGATF